MDVDTARSRALFIDKGFEYFKLYTIEKKQGEAKDSINSLLYQTINDKDIQLSNQRQQYHNSEKKAMNNLDLANAWRSKARCRSVKIVLVGVAGVVVGYLVGR